MESKLSRKDVFAVFDSVLEETERMGRLVRRLSPLTSGRSVVEEFDMIERITKRLEAENSRLIQNRIQTVVNATKPIYLFGDPVKFDQLTSNLLLNSIDGIRAQKGPGNRKITIDVARRDRQVIMTFSDTGTGIPATYKGKVFDPFFTTKPPGKGEGLGLFIVWNIMKMWGGKVWLDPKYKEGAKFVLSFPEKAEEKKEVSHEQPSPASRR